MRQEKKERKKKKRRKAAGMKNQSRTTYNKLFQLKKKEKGKCSQPTLSDTGGFLNLECDVCVCVDCKGPLDRALFTHPDRKRAVKNKKQKQIKLRHISSRVSSDTEKLPRFSSSFPLCVCAYSLNACMCVCILKRRIKGSLSPLPSLLSRLCPPHHHPSSQTHSL